MIDRKKLSQLEAVVFDLDDTLFDTYGLLVKTAARQAVEAMVRAGLPLTVNAALELREKLFQQNPRANVYEAMLKELYLTDHEAQKIAQAGLDAFHNREVEKHIVPFPSTLATLASLRERYRVFCVTVGNPGTQKQKINLLKLQNSFDKIWYVDVKNGHSKSKAYKELLKEYSLEPSQVLSVGNRIDSEIKDSKELGMLTCLVLHGEYLHLKPSSPFEVSDFEIQDVGQLVKEWKL